MLTEEIFLPWKFVNWRSITASTIDLFLHWHTDAPIINPDIVRPTIRSKNSIQAVSHVSTPHVLFLANAGCMECARRAPITTIAIACSSAS